MKTTYPLAIYDAVFDAGMISHAALCNALKERGMDNAAHFKLHLKRMTGHMGKLSKNQASYTLSEASKSEMSNADLTLYKQRLDDANKKRANKEIEKQAGRLREAKRVSKAFKAAQKPVRGDKKLYAIGRLGGL